MEFNVAEFIDESIVIITNILKPLVLSGLGWLSVYLTKCAKRVIESIEAKNELENMSRVNEMRSNLLKEIETSVKAAVGSNMQIANKMKERGKKLTDDQISELQNSAKKLIMDSLPESLTTEGGTLLKIIGGKDKLDITIDNMLETAVYEYKMKNNETQNNRRHIRS